MGLVATLEASLTAVRTRLGERAASASGLGISPGSDASSAPIVDYL